jgi:UDP-N-acetylmuramoylalanine--D-glutamate ligase
MSVPGMDGRTAAETFSVEGRRVVVVGAARSGIAAADLLVGRGASVTLSESRATVADADRLRARGVTLEVGGHNPATFAGAELIVTSPGVPLEQPAFDAARARGVEVIGELELAWRWARGRVIAITGTKGKSTTTTLIGRMLRAAGFEVTVGGNIGVPFSSLVEASTTDTVHVIEASSFQLETTTRFRPWIGVWLNLAADHLDRHPSFDAYGDAKARVFANQTEADWLVVNDDDHEVVRRTASARSRRLTFSLEGRPSAGFTLGPEAVLHRTGTGVTPLLPLSAVELTGRHMLNNVLAAVATTWAAGVPGAAMAEGLRGFRGLEHVMEPAGAVGGVRFVNDSKATNVEAARRSIESFDRGVVAIVGGRFKGGDLRELREALVSRGRAVVAIGEAAPLVRAAVDGVVPVLDAGSMADAVRVGFEAAQPDGVVVLAPACASFDWFADYAERGRAFKDAVALLGRDG